MLIDQQSSPGFHVCPFCSFIQSFISSTHAYRILIQQSFLLSDYRRFFRGGQLPEIGRILKKTMRSFLKIKMMSYTLNAFVLKTWISGFYVTTALQSYSFVPIHLVALHTQSNVFGSFLFMTTYILGISTISTTS